MISFDVRKETSEDLGDGKQQNAKDAHMHQWAVN